MRNRDVCNIFFNKGVISGSNLVSTGEKLFSYSTCIAQWDNDTLIVNDSKYSTTSSIHSGYLNSIISNHFNHRNIITVTGVPRGTSNLKSYVE